MKRFVKNEKKRKKINRLIGSEETFPGKAMTTMSAKKKKPETRFPFSKPAV